MIAGLGQMQGSALHGMACLAWEWVRLLSFSCGICQLEPKYNHGLLYCAEGCSMAIDLVS
jgi:hypothetical protein